MNNKEEVLHLIAETANYILDSNPRRMVISLHQRETGLHLCVTDDTVRPDEELEAMSKSLNSGLRPELAEYYGSMGGSDLLGTARLNLIGWQVKHSEVSRTDKGTKVDLWIGSNQFDSSGFNLPPPA